MSKPPPARGVRAGVRQDAKGGAASGAYDPRGAGSAWSHGFLNQKPWHPLSFRNQQRKWEAEQKQTDKEKKLMEGKAEFDREQEQFRSLSYLTPEEQKKFKDKQQLAFMYMKPPGLDAALKKEKNKSDDESKREEKRLKDMEQAEESKRPQETVGFGSKGPMAQMLKARAEYEASHWMEFRQMSPPRGGFDKDAKNQQFLPPDIHEMTAGGESQSKAMEKGRKKAEKRKLVEHAEVVLRAAGYNVDQISKHFNKSKRTKHQKSDKKRKRHKERSKASG